MDFVLVLQVREICTLPAATTRGSAITEGPRDVLRQLKSCQLLHNCTKNHIQGHSSSSEMDEIGHYHFPLVVCGNVSILNSFPDSTTFTVYRTACVTLKSPSVSKQQSIYSLCTLSNSCVNIPLLTCSTLSNV